MLLGLRLAKPDNYESSSLNFAKPAFSEIANNPFIPPFSCRFSMTLAACSLLYTKQRFLSQKSACIMRLTNRLFAGTRHKYRYRRRNRRRKDFASEPDILPSMTAKAPSRLSDPPLTIHYFRQKEKAPLQKQQGLNETDFRTDSSRHPAAAACGYRGQSLHRLRWSIRRLWSNLR